MTEPSLGPPYTAIAARHAPRKELIAQQRTLTMNLWPPTENLTRYGPRAPAALLMPDMRLSYTPTKRLPSANGGSAATIRI
jgi:hypothetical protein